MQPLAEFVHLYRANDPAPTILVSSPKLSPVHWCLAVPTLGAVLQMGPKAWYFQPLSPSCGQKCLLATDSTAKVALTWVRENFTLAFYNFGSNSSWIRLFQVYLEVFPFPKKRWGRASTAENRQASWSSPGHGSGNFATSSNTLTAITFWQGIWLTLKWENA